MSATTTTLEGRLAELDAELTEAKRALDAEMGLAEQEWVDWREAVEARRTANDSGLKGDPYPPEPDQIEGSPLRANLLQRYTRLLEERRRLAEDGLREKAPVHVAAAEIRKLEARLADAEAAREPTGLIEAALADANRRWRELAGDPGAANRAAAQRTCDEACRGVGAALTAEHAADVARAGLADVKAAYRGAFDANDLDEMRRLIPQLDRARATAAASAVDVEERIAAGLRAWRTRRPA